MIKNRSTLETLQDFLMKARKRLHDENPDYSDADEEQDPDGLEPEEGESEDEGDAADQWLKGHADKAKEAPAKAAAPEEAAAPVSEDAMQPSREELAQMREYTRPWEQRARDKTKLEAEPSVNPGKHHQGRLVEARNTSHADRQKAYDAFSQSPDFQNADPITQMEMESKFHDDWHKQNPEHLSNALAAHADAHKKGSQAAQVYNQAKDEKIRHIASGGAQPGSMSVEEGMQHVGGSRDDDDSAPSGIQQDKGAAFANGNQDFIQQYMKNYDKKAKNYSDVSDMDQYDPETRKDVSSVLGDPPAFKDPAKKRQFDQFVSKYHPLIGKAARQVLSKLGLTDKANSGQIDPGMLHEAGTHALFQAINDYNHDHPSKAKFTTHLNRKMHGLMQSALKAHDEIPSALRSGAKKFDQAKRNENAADVKHTNKEGVTTTIKPSAPKKTSAEIAAAHHPDIQDRLKRVAAARAPIVRRQTAQAPKPAAPAGPKRNINFIAPEEGGEE